MKTINQYYPLPLFLSAAILVNCLFLFMNGYEADLGFWYDWTKQLTHQGYKNFNGNYPPVYLHWIYLVGNGLDYFKIPIENSDLLKFFWVFPVFISHLLLIFLLNNLLVKYKARSNFHLSLMLLATFNPALIINGPIWGQVDLLPACIAMSAIYIHFSSRYAWLMIPLFTLALLTKLQMICFAPVVGILFFHKAKQHVLGMALSILLIALVFLPFYSVDYHRQIFKQAYLDTLGQYPVITMNAANIWIWLIGNNAPDNIQIISNLHPVFPDSLAKAKYFGMFMFASVCMMVFVIGVSQFFLMRKKVDEQTLVSSTFFYAMVSAIAFFALLPAMHERYLFPAVVAALLCAASKTKHLGYAVLLSLAASLNMLIILGINGSDIWLGLSVLVTILLLVSLLEMFLGSRFYDVLVECFIGLVSKKYSFPLVFVLVIVTTLGYLLDRYSLHKVILSNNQKLLMDFPITQSRQDYGNYRLNASVDGNILTINDKRYANGIGTHAKSEIIFAIPVDAKALNIQYGLDDEVGSAEVVFEIWEDTQLLWRSEVIYGYESVKEVQVSLNAKGSVTLKVDSHGPNTWDHVDWINPVIIF
jgi:Gpi18-like mannosyltransferase